MSDHTTTSAPTLRRATPADAALVAALHTASRASTYRGMLPDDYLDRAMPVECVGEWQARLAAQAPDGGLTLVAERDGEAVGFISVDEPDADASVYVANLHARPDRKGGGLGTTLLAAAAAWARERGAARMHLRVLEANVAAIAFYEARGWTFSSSVDDEIGGHRIVARIYTQALAPAPARDPQVVT